MDMHKAQGGAIASPEFAIKPRQPVAMTGESFGFS
jgi:hypothetical protein